MKIDPFYFLDHMSAYELDSLLTAYSNQKKEKYEMFRLLSFYVLSPYSSKKDFKPEDILSFTWDKEKTTKGKDPLFEQKQNLMIQQLTNKLNIKH